MDDVRHGTSTRKDGGQAPGRARHRASDTPQPHTHVHAATFDTTAPAHETLSKRQPHIWLDNRIRQAATFHRCLPPFGSEALMSMEMQELTPEEFRVGRSLAERILKAIESMASLMFYMRTNSPWATISEAERYAHVSEFEFEFPPLLLTG